MRRLLPFAFALLLAGCPGRASDIAVVSRVLKSDVNASTSGGLDAGMSVPSSGSIYWMEGQVKNDGPEEARKVTITFRVTDGTTTTALTAEVPSIPSGKTVGFRTPVHTSRVALHLIEEEPGIRMER